MLALLATGCASGGFVSKGAPKSSVSSSPSAAPAPSASPSATPSPTPTPSSRLSGILVQGGSSSGSGITVSGYAPATGQVGNSIVVPAVSSDSSNVETLPAQRFSPDFSKAVWSSEGHVGFVDIVTGAVHDLTPPKGSSYGSFTPEQSRPFFNPKTGELWFFDANVGKYMSLDPENPAKVTPQPNPVKVDTATGSTTVFFSADGSTFASASANSDGVTPISPDGKFAVVKASNQTSGTSSSLALHKFDATPDQALSWVPGTGIKDCAPLVFVDATSFLCTGTQGSTTSPSPSASSTPTGNNLYRVTISGTTLSPLALLPVSENKVTETAGLVVSPDATSVAFVAQTSSSATASSEQVLYTVSLTGNTEPVRVTSLTGSSATLIGWVK